MTNWPLIHLCEARMYFHRRKYEYDNARLVEHQGEVARSKKAHHPEAQKRAEVLVQKWGPLVGHEAREIHKYAAKIAELRPKDTSGIPQSGEGICTPKTAWNPYRRRMANWIARELRDAWLIEQGWYVTSGLRTYTEQEYLYHKYKYEGGNIAAKPGESNHEGWDYAEPSRSDDKSGAADVEPAERLASALRQKRAKGHITRLLWAEENGLDDKPHFSRTGH